MTLLVSEPRRPHREAGASNVQPERRRGHSNDSEADALAGIERERYLADIPGDISKEERLSPSRLLLKGIRTLPEGEQEVVLSYLLDRAHAGGGPFSVPSSFTERRLEMSALSVPQWAAWLILRRIADGATVVQLASELRVDPDALRAALEDVANRSLTDERSAAVLRKVAEGSTIEQVASELALTEDKVKLELEPTETLSAAFCACLMARAALPRPPAGQLGIGPQGPLRTMPVRFPEPQYQRLKDWSEQHNFPMAVVVRGLVERFLDEQHADAD